MSKFFISTILVSLFFVASLFADPPKKVLLNLSNDTLTVTAIHKVSNIKKHFINKITITADDSVIISKDYSEQTDKKQMVQKFILPKEFLTSEKIFVKATCNKYGSKTEKLVTTTDKK